MLPDIPQSWTPWITGVIGLAGVGLGALLNAVVTERRERRKARLEFIARQLDEFYGPLAAQREEIRTISVLRVELDKLAGEISAERLGRLPPDSDAWHKASDAEREKLSAQIGEENRILKEVLLPGYRAMIETFRDKMWLADYRTRPYFSVLIRFVQIWERSLNKTIPAETQQRLGMTENSLDRFYLHVEDMIEQLQAELGRT